MIEISPAPTRDNCLIHLHPSDNVAIARVTLEAGRQARVSGVEITLGERIPAGHKAALTLIEEGSVVLRYGQPIGRAGRRIRPGEHVHLHNLLYEEPGLKLDFPGGDLAPPPAPADAPVFLGFPRAGGRVGVRNFIAVVAASNCASRVAEVVARRFEGQPATRNVDGVAAFPHHHGCGGLVGRDGELLRRTIAGVLDHPNVFGAVLIGLGCELNQVGDYASAEGFRNGRLAALTLQNSGGTRSTAEEAARVVARLIEEASAAVRVRSPASGIVLDLNCGGSDSFSGITANPALGVCTDLLTAAGGTAVLAETPEIFGAEHLLVERAASRAVAERLLGFIRGYKEYVALFGGSLDDNPATGNKEGGLTNIVEKSLGAVAKGGGSVLMDAIDYAERIRPPGLVFMNTPGYDPVSLAGLAAGGVNLIAFTTGRGSAIGFPTVPVIKIASNSAAYRGMRENMDLNAGAIADGARTPGEAGREIFETVLRVASGEKTASERLGHSEFVPWRAGPVL